MFDEILIRPLINIVVVIYQGLSFLHVPFAFGFSIILLTVFIRFVLYPFTASQMKASSKMQKLTPHLSGLKEKHKGDAKRLQEETMKLYKEHGVNPAAGCLPVLIQFPIIWGLYSVLAKIVSLKPELAVSEINKVLYSPSFHLTKPWDQNFFGIPLSHSPSQLLNTMPLLLLVPVLTALFQFIQSKMMYPQQEVSKNKKELVKKKSGDDFASAFQTQSMYIFPIMIGFFSYSLPVGLSLYWNTFTIFGILQQYRVSGMGQLQELIDRIIKKK